MILNWEISRNTLGKENYAYSTDVRIGLSVTHPPNPSPTHPFPSVEPMNLQL